MLPECVKGFAVGLDKPDRVLDYLRLVSETSLSWEARKDVLPNYLSVHELMKIRGA